MDDPGLESGLIYLGEDAPIIVFGAVTGASLGGIKGAVSYVFPKLGKKGVFGGMYRGGMKGAKEGLLFPLKVVRAGVSDIPRNLIHYKEYTTILFEELRLAKEWPKY